MLVVSLFYCVIQAFKLDQFFHTFDGLYLSWLNHPAVAGFVGNPTHLSAYLGMLLPVLFMLRKPLNWLSIILLFIIILFFTNFGSHTVPITGIVVSVGTLLYYLFKTQRKLCIVISVCLAIGIGTAFFLGGDRYRKDLPSFQGRVTWWTTYSYMMKDTFITGKGLGTIRKIAPITKFPEVQHLHCEPFQFLFEIGLIGLLAIVFCLWEFFHIKVQESKEVIILKAVFIGFLLQSLTLYPAHLWVMSSIAMFVYSGIFCIKNEEILCKP